MVKTIEFYGKDYTVSSETPFHENSTNLLALLMESLSEPEVLAALKYQIEKKLNFGRSEIDATAPHYQSLLSMYQQIEEALQNTTQKA